METSELKRAAAIHRAIALVLEAEQELEAVELTEPAERTSRLRHSFYKLLGFDNGRDYSEP